MALSALPACAVIYLLVGQPGTGKSTVAIDLAINRYAALGRRVACNFPLDFAPACKTPGTLLSQASACVIPDRPSRADLDSIGYGGNTEETAGLLIIDEAGTWLNTRQWQGKDREEIIDWLTQSRKGYWDIILIAQSPGMLDKQVRESCCEMTARIRRTDRVRILGMKLPRVHVAVVRYGVDPQGPVLERWIYRGSLAHLCYASYRKFGASNERYSMPTAMQTKFADMPPPLTLRDAGRYLLAFPVLCVAYACIALGLASRADLLGPVGGRRTVRRAAAGGPTAGLSDYKQVERVL